jgi:hypothetical protein
MLADFFAKYEGAMLYLDSDTYFTADPAVVFERIRPGAAVMHENEGRLAEERNTVARKLRRFVTRNAVTLASGEVVRIPDSTAMWNAGVIGLHEADRGALAPALPLTDALYAAYAKHNMEQLAVSYALGRRLEIRSAEGAIHHYWAVKPQIAAMLDDFFARTAGLPLDSLTRAAMALRPTAARPRKRRWYERLLGTR